MNIKKLASISKLNLDFFGMKWLSLLVICLFSIVVGMSTIKGTFTHNFYQQFFYPALVTACGDRVGATGDERNVKVIEFLTTKINTISCEDIPNDIASWSLGLQQTSQMYLINTLGAVWKMTGVDWGALIYLNVFLFTVSSVLAYYILMALGLRRLISLAGVGLIILSSLYLEFMPNYREFGKVPFTYASILFIINFVMNEFGIKKYLVLSFISGLVVGVGVGFRADLIVFIPLLCASIAFNGSKFKSNAFKIRICALLLFLFGFILFGYEILMALKDGNLYHVILLGLMSPFDSALNIQSDMYQFGDFYSDGYIENLVNAHYMSKGALNYIKVEDPLYSAMTLQYLLEIITNFPADIITRFLSSVIVMLSLAYNSLPMSGLFGVLSLSAVLYNLVACKAWRLIAIGSLFFLYICGFAFLQFMPRHYFHLQIISVALIGGVVQIIFNYSNANYRSLKFNSKFAFVFLIILFFPFVVLATFRFYQSEQLLTIFDNLQKLARNSKPLEFVNSLDAKSYSFNGSYGGGLRYFALDVKKCPSNTVMNVKYSDQKGFNNYSKQAIIRSADGGALVLFPVLSIEGGWGKSRAESINVKSALGCESNLHEIKAAELAIIPINLTLYGDWNTQLRYQVINLDRALFGSVGRKLFFIPDLTLVGKAWVPHPVVPPIQAPVIKQ